jgi:polyisoprenyl-phosphate glycosyltransferase
MISSSLKILHILAPCFNEGSGILLFLENLTQSLIRNQVNIPVKIFIFDDGSPDNTKEILLQWKSPTKNISLNILSIGKNLGHQQAIRYGLIYLASQKDLEALVVMDSDGEDDPEAITKMIESLNNNDIVFVRRGKRQEGLRFQISYFFYKILFKFITGNTIDFGNFSLLSKEIVIDLSKQDFIHFASELSKKNIKKAYITWDRKSRLHGNSKMKFQSLINHAFNSLIVYSEELIYLFLKFSIVMIIFCVIFICYILYQKLFTDSAILGWASTIIIGFFNSFIISLGFFVLGLILLKIRYISKIPIKIEKINCVSPKID